MAETPRRRRKLAAILMMDVVGYSRMMGRDEEAIRAYRDVRDLYDRMFELLRGSFRERKNVDFENYRQLFETSSLRVAEIYRREGKFEEAYQELIAAQETAEERFYNKVAPSPAFDPLREVWGDGFESFLREKVVCIPGDVGRPFANFDDEQFEAFEKDGGLDAIINSAGLVSFMPSLESAIRINALGAKNVLDAARRANAALVHVSTCFVAGRREGDVWEDEPVLGYFPRQDELRDDD